MLSKQKLLKKIPAEKEKMNKPWQAAKEDVQKQHIVPLAGKVAQITLHIWYLKFLYFNI
jgi:hypothetical protein